MKLNLHVPFKAWNGEEIKERKGEEEKAKMIDETVSLLLFSGDFIRPSSDAEMVAKQKLASYELYCKISKAKGVVELTAEEACIWLSRPLRVLQSGGYGQNCRTDRKK